MRLAFLPPGPAQASTFSVQSRIAACFSTSALRLRPYRSLRAPLSRQVSDLRDCRAPAFFPSGPALKFPPCGFLSLSFTPRRSTLRLLPLSWSHPASALRLGLFGCPLPVSTLRRPPTGLFPLKHRCLALHLAALNLSATACSLVLTSLAAVQPSFPGELRFTRNRRSLELCSSISRPSLLFKVCSACSTESEIGRAHV